MAVALGVLMGSDVIGIAVVGADMIEPVGSYLYVQQPWLEVYNNEVAGQQLLHDYPKQSQCYWPICCQSVLGVFWGLAKWNEIVLAINLLYQLFN